MLKNQCYNLVFLVVVLLVFLLVFTLGVRNVLLGVDNIVTLDVGLAGELSPPLGLSIVLAALLLLSVVQNLSVAVVFAISVALALTKRFPVEVVVRDVGPVDVLLYVIGGGEGGKSQKNNGDLFYETKKNIKKRGIGKLIYLKEFFSNIPSL